MNLSIFQGPPDLYIRPSAGRAGAIPYHKAELQATHCAATLLVLRLAQYRHHTCLPFSVKVLFLPR